MLEAEFRARPSLPILDSVTVPAMRWDRGGPFEKIAEEGSLFIQAQGDADVYGATD